VLLLLIATCILAGGIALSEREYVVRIPLDRIPLGRFAADLMRELRRLEDLHGSHLDQLSRNVDPTNPPRTQSDCDAIIAWRSAPSSRAARAGPNCTCACPMCATGSIRGPLLKRPR